jgi:hypothetical protein
MKIHRERADRYRKASLKLYRRACSVESTVEVRVIGNNVTEMRVKLKEKCINIDPNKPQVPWNKGWQTSME